MIGRQFGLTLLSEVAQGEVQNLRGKIDKLLDSRLIVSTRMNGETYYRFKHALVQDAAFSSLFRARRAALHGRIADAMEQGRHGGVPPEPVVLARHWARAGDPQRAVRMFHKAAVATLKRCAAAETYTLLEEALEQVALLEDEAARKRAETLYEPKTVTDLYEEVYRKVLAG